MQLGHSRLCSTAESKSCKSPSGKVTILTQRWNHAAASVIAVVIIVLVSLRHDGQQVGNARVLITSSLLCLGACVKPFNVLNKYKDANSCLFNFDNSLSIRRRDANNVLLSWLCRVPGSNRPP